MATKYNPYSDADAITKYKTIWQQSNAKGDTKTRDEAAKNAQKHYDALQMNGYGNIADELKDSGIENATRITDSFGKAGKVKTRDYLQAKAKPYGYTVKDSDFSYDPVTKEVSFLGHNLGAADYVSSDGYSYFNEDRLKNIGSVFNDSGIYKTGEANYNEQMNAAGNAAAATDALIRSDHQGMTKKYEDYLNTLYNSNPYTSSTGKAIMQEYQYKGGQASNDAVASTAGSNAGNIDSYAAANAARQQLAFTVAGTEAALADWNARMDRIQNALQNLSSSNQENYNALYNNTEQTRTTAQQYFDNRQTAMNNDIAREVEKTNVTGYVPLQWMEEQNPYLDENGSLVNPDIDYQEIINKQRDILNNPNASAVEKASAEKTIRDANDARNKKMTMDKYRSYLNTMVSTPNIDTAEVREADKDRTNALDIATATNETNKYLADRELEATKYSEDEATKRQNAVNQNAIDQIVTAAATGSSGTDSTSTGGTAYKPTLTAAQTTQAVKDGNITPGVIDAYNYYYGTSYTVDDPPVLPSETSGNSTGGTDTAGQGTSEGDSLINVVEIGPIDEERIKSTGVDEHGRKMIEDLQKYAANNGGVLTEDEVYNFVRDNSNANNTNLNQLRKVYSYLGLNQSNLDNLEDAGTWFWQWGDGVKEKN